LSYSANKQTSID